MNFKNQVLCIAFFSIVSLINLNSQEPGITASSGGYSTNGNISLSFTIGESVTNFYNNNGKSYGIGFAYTQLTENFPYTTISGSAWLNDMPFSDGYVIIIPSGPGIGYVSEQYSELHNGEFSFSYVGKGEYHILLMPDDTINYYPTYLWNKIDTSGAHKVIVDGLIEDVDLNLLSKAEYTNIANTQIEKQNNISIFPNPIIGNQLTIRFNTPGHYTHFEVIDVNGKKIIHNFINEDVTTGQSYEIDVATLDKGVYILIIKSDKVTERRTIIKV